MKGARPWLAVACLVCLTIGGCAAPLTGLVGPGDPFRPEIVPAERAVIYVFRDSRRFRNRPMRVLVDQHEAGDLGAGGYVAIGVAPGSHLVRVTGVAEASCEVTVRSGESAYVRVVARLMRPRQPRLELPDEDRARALIARTVRSTDPDEPEPATP